MPKNMVSGGKYGARGGILMEGRGYIYYIWAKICAAFYA